MKQDKYILLDMDGVLSNFMAGVSDLFGENVEEYNNWNVYEHFNLRPQEFWKKIEEKENFWLNLNPYPWAFDLVSELTRVIPKGNLILSTSPSLDSDCSRQKTEWVVRYFPGLQTSLMIGGNKYLMAADNKILIDDSDKNIRKFKDCGGKTLLFPQPWNSNRELVGSRIEYTKTQINQLLSNNADN